MAKRAKKAKAVRCDECGGLGTMKYPTPRPCWKCRPIEFWAFMRASAAAARALTRSIQKARPIPTRRARR